MSATETPQTTTTAPVEERLHRVLASGERPPRASAWSASVTFGWRGIRKIRHVPEQLLDVTVTPVLFLLMFTYLFGGALEGSTQEYLQVLLPGMLVQSVLFTAVYSGVTLNTDMTKGVVDRFRSLPMSRIAVLVGRTLSDLVRSAGTLTLMVAVGMLIGYRWQTSLGGVVAAIGVGLAFGYALSWVMAVIGLAVRTAEAVQAAVYLGVFPLAFTSSVFVPTATMPAWLQPFAANQPVTVATNALRGLILGPGALPPGQTVGGQVALVLLWSAAIIAVFAPIAVRLFRRTST